MKRVSLIRLFQNMPLPFQVLLVSGAVVIAFVALQMASSRQQSPSPTPLIAPLTTTTTTTATLPLLPTEIPDATASPQPTGTPLPTPTLLPPEGGLIYAVAPYVNRVGWVVSNEEGNRFGESDLYAGTRDGRVYYGAFQFDLSFLQQGTNVHYAAVELTGLDEAPESAEQGEWLLKMLGTEIDPEFPLHGFDEIFNAPVSHELLPALTARDLDRGKTNVFVLDAGERAELEERVDRGVISFRLDGPSAAAGGLYAWDSGYGELSQGKGPILRLAVSLPPPDATPAAERLPGLGTPTPTYVVITSEPKPLNILTAAVDALTATAWATVVGTPTPLPLNWVTPIVVTATPTPANWATATAQARYAEAEALLTGTPTPIPGNIWTATPTATWVVITPVPTPENPLTAVADAITATAWARSGGTPTPLPPNWVTPIIVTATPTAGNLSTAEARDALATAEFPLYGTATPVPDHVWVVTPLPRP